MPVATTLDSSNLSLRTRAAFTHRSRRGESTEDAVAGSIVTHWIWLAFPTQVPSNRTDEITERLTTNGGVAENTKPSWPLHLNLKTEQYAKPNSIRPGRCSSQVSCLVDARHRRERSIADLTINQRTGDGHNFTERGPNDTQGRRPPSQSQKSVPPNMFTDSEYLRMGVCWCGRDDRQFSLHIKVRSSSYSPSDTHTNSPESAVQDSIPSGP